MKIGPKNNGTRIEFASRYFWLARNGHSRESQEYRFKFPFEMPSPRSYSVTHSDRLDYFGRTVNITARVAALSNAGDIILTGELWGRPQVREVIERAGVRALHFETTLRGVETSRDLVRLKP